MKVIFYGTPDFAVDSLSAIIGAGHEVLAVVTAPDRAAGRGRKLKQSPVKDFAISRGFKILQPLNLKDSDFIQTITEMDPEMQIVVAFRMMPQVLWSIPQKGTINLHASLLPNYRGAAPINHAIINGETESGLTTFYINEVIDTGDILFQDKVSIEEQDTFETLHDRMKVIGANLLVSTIQKIESGAVIRKSQSELLKADLEQEWRIAPKINKEFCRIDWHQESAKVYDHIRGLSPYPSAYSILKNPDSSTTNIKIYSSEKTEIEVGNQKPGTIQLLNKTNIGVACKDFFLNIKSLKPEGKNLMEAKDFINGYNVDETYSLI